MHFVCLYEARLHDLYRSEFLKYETSPGWEGLQGEVASELGRACEPPPWSFQKKEVRIEKTPRVKMDVSEK